MLVEQAAPAAGRRVLDLGCGTGTLAIQVKRRQPYAEVVGLDADPEMLDRARSKAAGAGVELEFDRGLLRRAALRGRELRPGPLHALLPPPRSGAEAPDRRARSRASFARAASCTSPTGASPPIRPWPSRSSASGSRRLRQHRGQLPRRAAARSSRRPGSRRAEQTDRLRTVFGTLALYRADARAKGRPGTGPNRDGPALEAPTRSFP